MIKFKDRSPDDQYLRQNDSFVQVVLSASDTPSLIRAIAMKAEYMSLCKRLAGTTENPDANLKSAINRICRSKGVSYRAFEQKLIPAARSLGIGAAGERQNFYKILGVRIDASQKEIKSAFRRKALEVHPDVNSEAGAGAEKFLNLQTAYRVLSDPLSRKNYDLENFSKNWNENSVQLPRVGERIVKESRAKTRFATQASMIFMVLCLVVFMADFLHKKISMEEEIYIPKKIAGSSSIKPGFENACENEKLDSSIIVPAVMPSMAKEKANEKAPDKNECDNGLLVALGAKKEEGGSRLTFASTSTENFTKNRPREKKDDNGDFSGSPRIQNTTAKNQQKQARTKDSAGKNTAKPRKQKKPVKNSPSSEKAKDNPRKTPGKIEKQKEIMAERSTAETAIPNGARREKNYASDFIDTRKGDLVVNAKISPAAEKTSAEKVVKTTSAEVVLSNENEMKKEYDVVHEENGNIAASDDERQDARESSEFDEAAYHGRLNSFFDRFTQAYERKDFTVYRTFFSGDATENGKNFRSLGRVYKKTFENIDSISYMIEVNDLEFVSRTKKINVKGEFVLIFKIGDSEKNSLRKGKILFELEENDNELLINRMVYHISDTG